MNNTIYTHIYAGKPSTPPAFNTVCTVCASAIRCFPTCAATKGLT